MNIPIYTGRDEQILMLTVRTLTGKPEKIRLVVCDRDQNNTVFTNRYKVFDGDQSFWVRMPISPKVALVQVYNEANGNLAEGKDKSFTILSPGIERLPLIKKMNEVDMRNRDVRSFINLAKRFSFYLGVMDCGKYQSDDGRIQIQFDPVILRDGKPSSTPARISEDTRIIEVAQNIMLPFTVPMRFAILCHEFAHCYLNSKPESEVEADLQGLLIYLGLGFPRVEGKLAFTQTFQGVPTELNAKRYSILNNFIDNFENHQFFSLEY